MYLLLFVLAALLGVFQAQPQRSPSSIEGVVTRLGTTEPLANANVQLNLEVSADRRDEIERQLQPDTPPIDSFHRKATTDGNGHFFFDSKPLCPNASSNWTPQPVPGELFLLLLQFIHNFKGFVPKH